MTSPLGMEFELSPGKKKSPLRRLKGHLFSRTPLTGFELTPPAMFQPVYRITLETPGG